MIGGLLVLWWTRPSARAVVRSEPAATGTITPDYSAIIPSLPTQEPESIARVAADTATPPPPAASAAPTPIQHKVASGESLGLIAEKYGIKVKDLMAANNLSGDFLRIGDVLTIPGSAAPQAPTLTPSPTGGTLIYKVSAGDTISDLAEKFGTRVDWILAANKMKDGDVLSIGQSILIPLSPDTPVPTVTGTPTPPLATFTPGVPRPTPALLTPADNATIAGGDQVLLTWTSVGLLSEDEWYVVTVRVGQAGKILDPYWTKATSWRLPAEYRPAGQGGTLFTWQVQLVYGKPGAADPRPAPIGQASVPRHFTW